ncbi:MAG: hypothetical protein QMD46_11050 [Methanomicrobiales archaeon]|nr:hypothetical protein [Methanomicrobiales archaeon]
MADGLIGLPFVPCLSVRIVRNCRKNASPSAFSATLLRLRGDLAEHLRQPGTEVPAAGGGLGSTLATPLCLAPLLSRITAPIVAGNIVGRLVQGACCGRGR